MEIGMQENIYLDILFTSMEQISSWITMLALIISSKVYWSGDLVHHKKVIRDGINLLIQCN